MLDRSWFKTKHDGMTFFEGITQLKIEMFKIMTCYTSFEICNLKNKFYMIVFRYFENVSKFDNDLGTTLQIEMNFIIKSEEAYILTMLLLSVQKTAFQITVGCTKQ
jgi:hypothetical protein